MVDTPEYVAVHTTGRGPGPHRGQHKRLRSSIAVSACPSSLVSGSLGTTKRQTGQSPIPRAIGLRSWRRPCRPVASCSDAFSSSGFPRRPVGDSYQGHKQIGTGLEQAHQEVSRLWEG